MTPREVHEAVEEVASTSYGRLVAYLASRTGDLSGAEDALADVFEAALRSWPTTGVPDRPVTWMLTAAKRSMIGRRRRSDTAARAAPTLAILADERSETVASAVPDKRLELLFACAHPAIDPTIHAPLMLQTVFGIDVARMSAAFLVEAPALGQRLVRAKRKIAAAGIPFELPGPDDLGSRTAVVLDAVYGAYGTGWDDPGGLDPGRSGLTAEAIRLADLLVELRPSDAESLGLASLLHHLEARAGARRDDQGRFVGLTEQDPWRWSPVHLAAGEQLLNRALALGAARSVRVVGVGVVDAQPARGRRPDRLERRRLDLRPVARVAAERRGRGGASCSAPGGGQPRRRGRCTGGDRPRTRRCATSPTGPSWPTWPTVSTIGTVHERPASVPSCSRTIPPSVSISSPAGPRAGTGLLIEGDDSRDK